MDLQRFHQPGQPGDESRRTTGLVLRLKAAAASALAAVAALMAMSVSAAASPDRMSVMDFCSPKEVATDMTACAQKAIDAAGSANSSYGGRKIFFPAQNSPYVLRGRLTLAKSFVGIEGDGPQASYISCANGDDDCIVVGSPDKQTRQQSIENIAINGDGKKTGGANIRVLNNYNFRIERTQIENCIRCLDIGPAVNSITLRDLIAVPNQTGSEYGIYWHAPGDGSARNDVLTLNNVVVEGNWSDATGLMWEGFSNTMVASHFRILHMRYGIRVANPAGSKRFFPSFMNAFDLELEGFKTRALSIEAGTDFKIVGSDIANLSGNKVQGSNDDVAVRILADLDGSITRGVQISDTRIGASRQSGILSDARDIQMRGLVLFSTSMAAKGAAPAIRLGPSSEDVQLLSITAEEFGGAARASHGLEIERGAKNIQVIGLNARYVAKSAILNNSEGPGVGLMLVSEPNGKIWLQQPASDRNQK